MSPIRDSYTSIYKIWISYRIQEDDKADYKKRWSAVYESIKLLGDCGHFHDTTSFHMIQTSSELATVAQTLQREVEPEKDHVIVVNLETKNGIFIGNTEVLESLKIFLPGINIWED